MSRETSGWEYVDGGPRWAPTVEGQIANMIYDLYDHEYDEARRQLDDLVRAAQRDAAEMIRTHPFAVHEAGGAEAAADLIFPDYPKEDGSE
ncbi:hypothetical protein [Streptomyces sp. NPDC055036]